MEKETIRRIFKRIPKLSTERLLLRKIDKKYAEDVYEYASLPEVTRYLLWEAHKDPAYSREYVNYLQGLYREGSFYDWGIVLRESGRLIGTCGFTRFDFENDSAEVGYVLHKDHWGSGLAAEALAEVLKFGFCELGLQRIEGHYMAENGASRRVMEKNGMTFEGILRNSLLVRGHYVDVGICAILREDYLLK